ncbi:hypothetical protein, partial [Streptomyces sp. 039-1]|uniref:hypothetical protein n=1 Tax=Streptomyces sp. 039-1 TaxID=2789263 RepID=UPI0039F474F5
LFDRYPVSDSGQFERRPLAIVNVAQNVWNSVGIANVTGLKYDRIETRFTFSDMTPGELEGEFRLATFRHYQTATSLAKQIVSSSDAWKFTGTARSVQGRATLFSVSVRWLHGLQYGWEYGEGEDNAVYTIELQHRYALQTPPDDRIRVFAPWMSGDNGNKYDPHGWRFGVAPGLPPSDWVFNGWGEDARPAHGWISTGDT